MKFIDTLNGSKQIIVHRLYFKLHITSTNKNDCPYLVRKTFPIFVSVDNSPCCPCNCGDTRFHICAEISSSGMAHPAALSTLAVNNISPSSIRSGNVFSCITCVARPVDSCKICCADWSTKHFVHKFVYAVGCENTP